MAAPVISLEIEAPPVVITFVLLLGKPVLILVSLIIKYIFNVWNSHGTRFKRRHESCFLLLAIFIN